MPLQSFTAASDPAQAAPRIAALRQVMSANGWDAVMVPRADAHQGEYVTEADARLRWLTGFSGSAGFAIVTQNQAGVFIDGRYRLQVRAETDPAIFTPVPWPETRAADWLRQALPDGGKVAFDSWLHTRDEIAGLERALAGSEIGLIAVDNPIDALWTDRPAAPVAPARVHPDDVAGQTADDKRDQIAGVLQAAGQAATIFTLPDSIAWLLNLRGGDVERNPIMQGFAILESSGQVTLFVDPAKIGDDVRAALGNHVTILPAASLPVALQALTGPVRLDPQTAPEAVFRLIEDAGTEVVGGPDPVLLPKARKNPAELQGMRDAHLRDAVAVVRALHWVDQQAPGSFSEIDVVTALEGYRVEAGASDISFDTIAGVGPNGAIMHYHVSDKTNRVANDGELLLLDSGGQYHDGTTDITRTMPVGRVDEDARDAYTRVLQGLINLSRLRFPKGVAGRDIDAVARAALWSAGMDFDHGTGHGVGAALSVHEGPVRIARRSEIPLEPGMILSNEPGYYREGAFGIRLENLIVVEPAESPDPGREMLGFETLTLVPLDRRLIEPGMLSRDETLWLDAYHARVRAALSPLVPPEVAEWLDAATAPLAAD
ncbi:MAG: X-Pro aminopeptidase [Paracoccus denitrificans]|nr:MAG: X-Pro aminopeptidase [Paracoccus denitrificans]PZO83445.1 MAG: X-Pro aminopeptidase [Paracoccus denitrificans]